MTSGYKVSKFSSPICRIHRTELNLDWPKHVEAAGTRTATLTPYKTPHLLVIYQAGKKSPLEGGAVRVVQTMFVPTQSLFSSLPTKAQTIPEKLILLVLISINYTLSTFELEHCYIKPLNGKRKGRRMKDKVKDRKMKVKEKRIMRPAVRYLN